MKLMSIVSAAAASALLSTAGYGMVISVLPVSGGGLDPSSSTYNAAAATAFQSAANDLATRFTDPISITVTANLTSAGFSNPNIIGSTTAVSLTGGYTSVRGALISDASANPFNNTVAVDAALPGTAPTYALPAGGTSANGSAYSFSANSGSLSSTKADFKALGFSGLDTTFGASDGTISFNSNFDFSYSGPQANKIDFKTTAEHEIIHLLGFSSATDTVDQDLKIASTAGTGGQTGSVNYSITPTVLDLYRFSAANTPTSLLAFTNNSRDLTPGSNDYTSDSSVAYRMSTGVYNGDTNQASHWKADELTGVNIGIMDPTLAYNMATPVSGADIRALQLLGYDTPVPEPIGLAIISLGGLMLATRHRRA